MAGDKNEVCGEIVSSCGFSAGPFDVNYHCERCGSHNMLEISVDASDKSPKVVCEDCGYAFRVHIGFATSEDQITGVSVKIEQEKSLGSKMEALFLGEAAKLICGLKHQHRVSPYLLDFAHLESMVAIEVDGHEYHKTKEQRARDAKRDRHLAKCGWTVIRFTGSEVYEDSAKCAKEAAGIIASVLGQRKVEAKE